MKTFAIVKDNIIQDVLYIGGGDYENQIDASKTYLGIEGEPIEIIGDMVKGEYFDKSLAPPEPEKQVGQEIEPKTPPEPDKNMQRMYELQWYLQITDWMIIRKAETGKEVPQDVLEKRQSSREEISRIKGEI